MKYGFWTVLLILIFYAGNSYAQLSPGKLSQVHSNLEGIEHCTDCHTSRKAVDPVKCLDCHTILKERIEHKKGLHANPKYHQCQTCHHEHFGRKFELVHWKTGKPEIDHSKTGWALRGNHQKLKCRDCHTSKFIPSTTKKQFKKKKKDLNRTFLGLDTRCLSCHQDVHRGQLDEDCLKCHTMAGWKPAKKFDHNRARFRLTGAHKRQPCRACHPTHRNNRYPDNPSYVQFTGLSFRRCTGCHTDIHRGKFGNRCQRCHITATWRQINAKAFNHDRTRFPLVGKHQTVACRKCHQKRGKQQFTGLQFDECQDCHTDYHKGQFSSKLTSADCDICHTEHGFRPSKFSLIHHQKTRFPLQGAHGAVLCRECHKPIQTPHGKTIQFAFASLQCTQCHSNVHGTAIQNVTGDAGCSRCHSTQAWDDVHFNHNQTDFALTGRHQQVGCRECHKPTQQKSGIQLVFNHTTRLCQGCHKEPHHQQFATKRVIKGRTVQVTPCEQCHETTDWHTLTFDHNRDSRFKLEGAHAQAQCRQCHPTVKGHPSYIRYKPLDTRCQACHGKSIRRGQS